MPSIGARDLQSLFGLPTSYTLIILIGVPLFVILTTSILVYYYLKARASRRARDRAVSKSSLNSGSDHDQEMALTSMGATFRPLTSESTKPFSGPPYSGQSFGFVAPTDKPERPQRPVVAGHGSGSEVFDMQQYESERVDERARNMLLPSPSFAPPRPRTAPGSNGHFERPDYNRTYPNSPAEYSSPYSRTNTTDEDRSRGRSHRRSASLGKPPPIRPPRPSHSPAGSVRALSIFPPKHAFPSPSINSPSSRTSPTRFGGHSPSTQSPSPSQLHHASSPMQSSTSAYTSSSPAPSAAMSQHRNAPSPPGQYNPQRTLSPNHNMSLYSLTPSPPLLSPIPTSSHRSPPKQPPIKHHGRHPSVERNSLMPIAPLILPHEPPQTILESVDEPPGSSRRYESGTRDAWRRRDNYI